MIKELCKFHTDLSDDDIEKITSITAILPDIAELVKADVFIDALTRSQNEAIVIAQAKPWDYQSLYRCSVVGQLAIFENEPSVIRTLKIGMGTRDLKAITQENIAVIQNVVPIKNDFGKTIAALIMEVDMTENINRNKRMEMLTETTEQLTETILSLTNSGKNTLTYYLNDAVVMFDIKGRVSYTNPVAQNLFNKLGYEENIIGMDFDNLTLDCSAFKNIITRKQLSIIDVTVGKLSLQIKYITPDTKNDLVSIIMIIKDVSEVKEKEKELILKSVAIREIHHRVKNNLQTIASLLRLQSRRVENDSTKVALNESISRILSIAVTHEILSQNGVDDVDIMVVLSKISDTTKRYFTVPNQTIDVVIKGDSFTINSDKATSIAMVVNELLQNSFEHAFIERDNGNIEVCIHKGNVYSNISVVDNGIGFDFNSINSKSLGIYIVRNIIKDKLNGNISIDSTPQGTKIIFDFKNE